MTIASHTAIQLALRTRLLTLSVATTGSVTLAATASGYIRVTGSFLTDGFAMGMEINPGGFASTPASVITDVSALRMVTSVARMAEVAASGRSLVAGLPSRRAWENITFTATEGTPYLEEQYLPGPEAIENDTYAGRLVLRPMYSPRIYVPSNTGMSADGAYADAIRRLFRPGTTMAVGTDTLVVRGDVAPYRGQRQPGVTAGWSCIPITIPLELRTISVPT